MKHKYDCLIVGAGLYGATMARQLTDAGRKVLVIDKRDHIGGNVYTENIDGINVHAYGAHIFHTNNDNVWEYVQRFAKFNRFTNSPIANYHGDIYSLPFNMHTFNRLWGAVTPQDAGEMIAAQREAAGISTPTNLEEQAIYLVGTDIYEKLIKGYTQKQWGRECKDLPAFIIKRLPVRFTYDNNYFDAKHQGIPIGGYTEMVKRMFEGVKVLLGIDYLTFQSALEGIANKVIFTGPIDAYYRYKYGPLEYRSLRFEAEKLPTSNFQGNAVVNYTDAETPWTRIIEHKWFEFGKDEEGNPIPTTIISREFSKAWTIHDEPYYPINDERNNAVYDKYRALAEKDAKVIFGGRLGLYQYFDMDRVIEAALVKADELIAEQDVYLPF